MRLVRFGSRWGSQLSQIRQVNISRQVEKKAIAGTTGIESTTIGFNLPASMQLTALKKYELKQDFQSHCYV